MLADMAANQKNCSCSGRQVGRHGSQHGGQTKNILADMEFDIVADKEVAKVAGHGGWLIEPGTLSARTLPADLHVCLKLCEFTI